MKAHELLSDPDKWIRGDYARANDGYATLSRDESAVCWCVNGALIRCYSDHIERHNVRVKIAMRVDPNSKDKPHDAIVRWNDSPERTFDEVVSVLKELDV